MAPEAAPPPPPPPETSGDDPSPSPPPPPRPKLSVLPLIALIFFEVSGGPFGIEDSVRAGGGPFLPLLGFLFLPLLWSLPEALITAELAASLPSNAGYVLWISTAFSPSVAFNAALYKWSSGALDNALYPILFLDYLPHLPFIPRPVAAVLLTAALTYLNYRGLHVVGLAAVLLAIFSLSPFLAMAAFALPRIRPHRWLVLSPNDINFRSYFNSMFWNLNYWDKASTLAGEVEDPGRSFPQAVFGALALVVGSYLIPLLAGTGAMESNKTEEWTDGYFAQVGTVIGGRWLGWWIQAAAAMSNMGLFEAEMSSDAFQLLGMAEMGMIPAIFATRSKYGTPTISILCSATGVVFLSWMSFQEIIEFLNFLYSLGMLLEFAAFIKLRIKKPDLHRPYRIPVQTLGAVILCIPPTCLLVLVMCLASARTFIVSGCVMAIGALIYPALQHMKDKKWVSFISTPVPFDSCFLPIPIQHIPDEASIRLLPDVPSVEMEIQDSETVSEVLKVE